MQLFKKAPFLGSDGAAVASGLSMTTPLPGTTLYDDALKQGKITDEEAYLTQLSGGYMHDGVGVWVIFTVFDKDEFFRLKRQTEHDILWSQIKRYPLQMVLDYLKKNGVRRTLGKAWGLLFKSGKEQDRLCSA